VSRTRGLGTLLMVGLGLSCARAGGPPPDLRQSAPAADSVTVALWRFDEPAGLRCGDSGPFRIDATAGPRTGVQYGRFANARTFARQMDSFVYAPHNPVLVPPGGLTVEAWVFMDGFGAGILAAMWVPEESGQSWVFGIGDTWLSDLIAWAPVGGRRLVFAFRPDDAGQPRAFASTQQGPTTRWPHVAASYDGRVVRFFIDGRLDAQFATSGRIRPGSAPLIIGNYFDPRLLTNIRGDLRVEATGGDNSQAFEGAIDELRISSTGRTEFLGTGAQ
jgi:hypothetical protein